MFYDNLIIQLQKKIILHKATTIKNIVYKKKTIHSTAFSKKIKIERRKINHL